MNISVKVIPGKEQRYPTCGDYWYDPYGTLEVRVSKMSDWRYEVLVAFHEICEAVICNYNGVSVQSIDAFDIQFEKDREAGLHTPEEEPGDHKDAPYRVQHFIATTCERILACALGVNWADYDNEVVNL